MPRLSARKGELFKLFQNNLGIKPKRTTISIIARVAWRRQNAQGMSGKSKRKEAPSNSAVLKEPRLSRNFAPAAFLKFPAARKAYMSTSQGIEARLF
jgi:hypothetical protein